jgi:hypothetical protein
VATALGIPPGRPGIELFSPGGGGVAGIGLLYLLSAASMHGFCFPTLLDQPLVLPLLGVLWYFGMVAGTIALVAGLQDLLTSLWTFMVWRQEFGGEGQLRFHDRRRYDRFCAGCREIAAPTRGTSKYIL